MLRAPFFVLTILLSATAPLAAQKPSTGPGNPALGYVIQSGAGWDLRIADESGTNAFRVYAKSNSVGFDLGSKGSNTAAVIDRDVAKLVKWQIGPSGSVSVQSSVLDVGADKVLSLAFSKDGTKLAVSASTGMMHVFDAATGAKLDDWTSDPALDVSWYSDGSGIVLNTLVPGVKGRLVEYAADGSNRTVLADYANLEDIDASPVPGSRAVLVSYSTPSSILLSELENGNQGPTLASGHSQSWRCDGSRFVYRLYNGSNLGPWTFKDANGTGSTFSKSSQIRRVRYMKC